MLVETIIKQPPFVDGNKPIRNRVFSKNSVSSLSNFYLLFAAEFPGYILDDSFRADTLAGKIRQQNKS